MPDYSLLIAGHTAEKAEKARRASKSKKGSTASEANGADDDAMDVDDESTQKRRLVIEGSDEE